MNNNIKKSIAKVLIVAMILSSNAFYTFADSMESDIDASKESKIVVEKTNYAEQNDSIDIESSDTGVNVVSPDEDIFGIAPTSTLSEVEDEEEDVFADGGYEEEPEEDVEEIDESTEESSSEEVSTEDTTDSLEETTDEETTVELESTTSEEETTIEEETTTKDETSTEEESTGEDETTTEGYSEGTGSIDSNEIATESDITNEEITATESVILSDEIVATDSIMILDDNIFGGVPGVSQTITLAFGDEYPLANSSSNWNVTSFAGQATVPATVTFTGNINTVISDFFVSNNYVTAANLPLISQETAGERHIVLPTFANDKWEGFTFDGWYDETDILVTELPYRFQDGDKTYTARWSKDTTRSYSFNIKYVRRTPYSTVDDEIATEYTNHFNHGSNVDIDAKAIDGYMISGVLISTTSWTSFNDLGVDSLKTQNYKKTGFIDYDLNPMTMSADYGFDGFMPNHDIYVKVYYVPDDTVTKTVTVNYVNENGTVIKDPKILDYSVETVIEEQPASDIERYEFNNAEITCAAENLDLGRLTLGSLHISGEMYTDDIVTSNNGQFKALMPLPTSTTMLSTFSALFSSATSEASETILII